MKRVLPAEQPPARFRRAASRAVGIALAFGGAVEAGAQESTALDRLEPAPAGDPFLTVPVAPVRGVARPAFGILGSYAHRLLVLRSAGGERARAAVENRTALHVLGSIAVLDRVLLAVDAPFVVHQSGAPRASLAGSEAYAEPPSAAVSDLGISVRAELYEGTLFMPSIALGATLFAPTGDADGYAGTGRVRVAPRATLSSDYGYLLWTASVSRAFEPEATPRGNLLSDQIGIDLAVAGRLAWAQLGVEVGLGAGVGATSPFAPPGFRLEPLASARAEIGILRLGLAGGPGFSNAPGSPALRLLASAGVVFDAVPPSLARQRSPEASARNQSAEGAARSLPGDPLRNARPTTVDGGAPAEHPTGTADRGTVRVEAGRILVLDELKFGNASAELLPESDAVLQAVLRALEDDPTIVRVAVDGHTDDRGAENANLELSRARAMAVVRWLIERGVDPRRLEGRGFGARQPKTTNDTDEGRAENRRVEFVIVRRDPRGAEAWVDGTLEPVPPAQEPSR